MFRNKYTTRKTTLIYRPVFKCIKMGIIGVSTFDTTLIYSYITYSFVKHKLCTSYTLFYNDYITFLNNVR